MFQNAGDGEAKGRSRLIMVGAAIAVVALFAAVLFWSTYAPAGAERTPVRTGLPNAKRAGDPEFEKHKGLISLVNRKFYTQANLLGQNQALATGDIMNFTDRTITGIELRGKVIGKDGQVKATALATPVPKLHERITPNKSVPYTVTIDGAPATAQIDDITIEVEGLVFGE